MALCHALPVTTLRHQLLDGASHPVVGAKAAVMVYLTGADGLPQGSYEKVPRASAVSDAQGWLTWTLPPFPGHGTPTYTVTGIEPNPVLIRVPRGVSTTTVALARIGSLSPADTSAVDLVTEDELTRRLSQLPIQSGSQLAADPALRAAFVPQAVKSGAGLTVTVSALQLDGWDFGGGSIDLPGRGTWYIGVDLFTKQIRTLPRPGHRGWVLVGKAVATASAITSLVAFTPELPATRLPRTMRRILDGQPIRVVVMGSSLTQSGGDGWDWPGMVFGAGVLNDYRVPGQVTVAYTGVGGSPNAYQLAQSGVAGAHGNATIVDGQAVDRTHLGTGRSQLFKDVDLVVLGCLANGGEQRLETIEATVRNLRKTGVEVLLVTDDPQGPSLDYDTMAQASLYVDGPAVLHVAERYSCEFADTAAYVFEGYLRQGGVGVYANGDTIHMKTGVPAGRTATTVSGGHELWARAVRSCFTVSGQQTVGELFPEGSFDTQSSWYVFGQDDAYAQPYTISGGKLRAGPAPDGAPGNNGLAFTLPFNLQGGSTYTVTFTVSAFSGSSWVGGLLREYVWAQDGAMGLSGVGVHTTTVTLPEGDASCQLMFWWQGATPDGATIEFESISLQGAGAPVVTDLAPQRRRSDQILPPSRIVTDNQIPGDAFVILPQDEAALLTGDHPGTLAAHPWGPGSFARRFSPRVGAANDLLIVSTGQKFVVSGTNPTALAFIRYADENDGPVTVDVQMGFSVVKTLTFTTPPFANEWFQMIFTPSELKAQLADTLGRHMGAQLTVTSGTLKVAGMVAFTAEQDVLDVEDLRFKGTWTRGTSRSGADGLWSDTVGDTVSVATPARRLYWEVSGNPGSKTFDSITDLEQASNVDTNGNFHLFERGGQLGTPGSRRHLRVATAAPGDQTNGWSIHVFGAIAVHDR